ncbi:GtrA family protein [Litorimonas sp. WD9-15]|uniref:GtrA family protein n=1 Tax=Litorimonas sp. WD9-15 TaxID=3418716 RepID=UPI003D000D19
MSRQLGRYLTAGLGTVALYVGGVWFGTEILHLPVRPTNVVLYIAATALSFALNYKWVFASKTSAGRSLFLFLLLQAFGVLLNIIWVEAGLRLTHLYPWIIAATYFAIWPFLSFAVQKRYIFNR